METKCLVLKPTEDLIHASTDKLLQTMVECKILIECAISADEITPRAWKEIDEVNTWMKTKLGPLLRGLIAEENLKQEKLTKKEICVI